MHAYSTEKMSTNFRKRAERERANERASAFLNACMHIIIIISCNTIYERDVYMVSCCALDLDVVRVLPTTFILFVTPFLVLL